MLRQCIQKITVVVLLFSSSGLVATSGASVSFVAQAHGKNALNAPVTIKIWAALTAESVERSQVQEFILAPNKKIAFYLSQARYPQPYWMQAYGKDGEPLSDIVALTARGLAPLQPGMMTTMDIGNVQVEVIKNGKKKVKFVIREDGGSRIGLTS